MVIWKENPYYSETLLTQQNPLYTGQLNLFPLNITPLNHNVYKVETLQNWTIIMIKNKLLSLNIIHRKTKSPLQSRIASNLYNCFCPEWVLPIENTPSKLESSLKQLFLLVPGLFHSVEFHCTCTRKSKDQF